MAEKREIDNDLSAVDESRLAVYDVEDYGNITTHIIVENVTAETPIRGANDLIPYIVEIEYQSRHEAVDKDSVAHYLESFEDCRISQEEMCQVILAEFKTTLTRCNFVYVEVRSKRKPHKKTWMSVKDRYDKDIWV